MAHALRSEDLDFVDRAPVQVREVVLVAGSTPEALWPALADASAWTEWFAGMKEARYTSPEPYGVGSTRFAFRVKDASVPALRTMIEVVTLEAADGGTKVVYRQSVEMEPWARLMGPVVRSQLRRSLRKSLPNLARWVAEHAEPGDAPRS